MSCFINKNGSINKHYRMALYRILNAEEIDHTRILYLDDKEKECAYDHFKTKDDTNERTSEKIVEICEEFGVSTKVWYWGVINPYISVNIYPIDEAKRMIEKLKKLCEEHTVDFSNEEWKDKYEEMVN